MQLVPTLSVYQRCPANSIAWIVGHTKLPAQSMKAILRPVFTLTVAAGLLLAVSGCESTGVSFERLSAHTQAAMDVLPADAIFVGMVDVNELGENQELSIEHALMMTDELEGEARARVDDFLRTTGFDPAKDLQSVYVAARDEDDAVVVANAQFDMERLIEFLDQNLTDARKSTYRDLTIYSVDGEENGAIGLAGESMIIAASDVRDVEQALDHILDGTKGLSGNASVMDLVGKVSGGGAWVVVSEIPAIGPGNGDEMSRALASVSKIAVSVSPGSDDVRTTTYLIPSSGTSVSDLSDLVKGFVAVLKLEARDNAEAFALLDAVEIRSGNGEVRIDAEVPTDTFKKISH